MDKKNVFKVLDETGKEIECEMLFTFDSDETGKNYMVYTDNSLDEEGNTRYMLQFLILLKNKRF